MNLDSVSMSNPLQGREAQVRPLSLLNGLIILVADSAQFRERLLSQAVLTPQLS